MFALPAHLESLKFIGDPPETGDDFITNFDTTIYYPGYNENWTEVVQDNGDGTYSWNDYNAVPYGVATFSGVVREKKLTTPISGVTVDCVPPDDGSPSIQHTARFTATDGSFKFENLKEGTYTVTFRKSGYQDVTRSLNLERDKDVIWNEVQMESTTVTGTLQGVITNEESREPIAGATIVIVGIGSETIEAISGTDGSFYIQLREGSYTITITKSGFSEQVKDITITTGLTSEYVVQMRENKSKSETTKFHVRIMASSGGLINDPLVILSKEDTIITSTIDGDSDIYLLPGNYTIEVTHDNYESYRDAIDIRGKEQSLDVTLNWVKHEEADLQWNFDESTGTLSISCDGPMKEYGYHINYDTDIRIVHTPWSTYDIQHVNILPGVTRIADAAFIDCQNLISVNIPNSVNSIGKEAFRNCTNLSSVIIPNSVSIIGAEAFEDCTKLTNVSIPSSVKVIGQGAFEYCTSLTNLMIPDSVTTLGGAAFYGCSSLVDVSLPTNLTIIGEWLFAECAELTSVSIPNSVIQIEDGVFYNCRQLKDLTIPCGVLVIGARSFEGCSSLSSIVIPDGIISIGDSAFDCCTSLVTVSMPESVKVIGGNAFNNCANLTALALPSELTCINSGTFSFCKKLNTIVISENVTSIGEFAFYGCVDLRSITLSKRLQRIGDYAFYECSSLTSISIPAGIVSIGSQVFWKCDALKSINYQGTEEQLMLIDRGFEWMGSAKINFQT